MRCFYSFSFYSLFFFRYIILCCLLLHELMHCAAGYCTENDGDSTAPASVQKGVSVSACPLAWCWRCISSAVSPVCCDPKFAPIIGCWLAWEMPVCVMATGMCCRTKPATWPAHTQSIHGFGWVNGTSVASFANRLQTSQMLSSFLFPIQQIGFYTLTVCQPDLKIKPQQLVNYFSLSLSLSLSLCLSLSPSLSFSLSPFSPKISKQIMCACWPDLK